MFIILKKYKKKGKIIFKVAPSIFILSIFHKLKSKNIYLHFKQLKKHNKSFNKFIEPKNPKELIYYVQYSLEIIISIFK